ncbi:flagellar motor protein MotB [Hylemonella sp. W303a]|uniref:flagellar motor protein MotB n=1 Tax=Hylemonella sp. W303a TaxID=3389873 RepID=UPI00396B3FC2
MATDAKKLQPIIIKRVKKGGHGVHGGAWKIAYADFVTAMMAFFLLMWLLGSTSKGDLKGLADYFRAPLKVSMVGGNGSGASSSILPGGGADLTLTAGQHPEDASAADRRRRAETARRDAQRLAALSAKISAAISNNAQLRRFSRQIQLESTPDGLKIQIVDEQGRPMFTTGNAAVQPYMRDILREIGAALNGVENKISLDGHTDVTQYGNQGRSYSNWELSADRANAARRELVAAGMPEDKLLRVTGLAASNLLVPDNPTAPANRRISIMVLTKEAEERQLGINREAVEPGERGAASGQAVDPALVAAPALVAPGGSR